MEVVEGSSNRYYRPLAISATELTAMEGIDEAA